MRSRRVLAKSTTRSTNTGKSKIFTLKASGGVVYRKITLNLWGDIRISTLSKVINIGYKENAVHYLKDIKDIWSQIFRHNKQAMQMLDNATVKAVELTSPKHSKQDAQMLHGQLVNGQIFAAFNLQDRELYTIQNVTHLPPPSEPSSEETKTKRKRLAKARPGKVNEIILSNFATLAIRLGFKSNQISALSQRSADREIARAALLNARKSGCYEYTNAILESNIKQIVRLFNTATPVQVEQVYPAFVSNNPAALGIQYKFPNNKAHTRDTDALSIANLHVKVTEQGESVTSFFIRKSVYFTFFNKPSKTNTNSRSHPSPPQDPSFKEVKSSPLQQSRPSHASNTSSKVQKGPEHKEAGREGSILRQEGLARLEHAARPKEQEEIKVEVLIPNKQLVLLNDPNSAKKGVASSQPTTRDQRRGTFLNLENLIVDRLASTSRGPATEDHEALVRSYRDLISTDNVDTNNNRQEHHQAPDKQLQILPAASTIRIKTDRSLLINISNPSKVEQIAKKYIRKGIQPYDSSLKVLILRTYFQVATIDGSNTILLVPENRIKVNKQLIVSVSKEMPEEELPPRDRQNRARQ
ncbi:hypothetical protein BKA65DRAFT_520822 [Rhexocercosporidium sp. MPI-PUGE-AT-0058]|nr:hypothetical protein BKA65DRAFT_520822 [Rhexocercosporidium sp. MPI-PUGE-AT-0058]